MTMKDVLAREAKFAPKTQAIGQPCENESELHAQIMSICKNDMWIPLHSAWGRKTGRLPGEPDFTIICPDGVVVFVECKKGKEKLTEEQRGVEAWLRRLGHTLYVVHNVQEFLAAIEAEREKVRRRNSIVENLSAMLATCCFMLEGHSLIQVMSTAVRDWFGAYRSEKRKENEPPMQKWKD
jgi:hypothetical protein